MPQGEASQMILAFLPAKGPGSDVSSLNKLRREASSYGRYEGRQPRWLLVGDAGFDGDGVEPGDLIPPVRRRRNLVSPERRAKAELVAAARLDGIYSSSPADSSTR